MYFMNSAGGFHGGVRVEVDWTESQPHDSSDSRRYIWSSRGDPCSSEVLVSNRSSARRLSVKAGGSFRLSRLGVASCDS